MRNLGVAVWGIGRHAKNRILPAISAVETLTLVGICSRSKDTVNDCAKQWNCFGWTEPKKMLDHPDVDIIILTTPTGLHLNHGVQILAAGKHLWCEKPLTCNYKDTLELIHLSKKKGLMVAEGFMYLYHPHFLRVKKFVDAKELGRVCSVNCQFGIPTLEEPGFQNNANLYVGSFWDVGSYTVSAILELFDGQQHQILFAEIDWQPSYSIDRGGRALIRFSEGSTAYLEWGIGLGYRNEINIWSEQGSLYTDKIFSKPVDFQPTLKLRNQYGSKLIEQLPVVEQFEEMFKFYSLIFNNSQHLVKQRKRILKVAKVMDDILKLSQMN